MMLRAPTRTFVHLAFHQLLDLAHRHLLKLLPKLKDVAHANLPHLSVVRR